MYLCVWGGSRYAVDITNHLLFQGCQPSKKLATL